MEAHDEFDELDEDLEEDRPWETFKISEETWTRIWKDVQHANIDSETIADLFNHTFPNGEDAAKAYACFLILSDEFEE